MTRPLVVASFAIAAAIVVVGCGTDPRSPNVDALGSADETTLYVSPEGSDAAAGSEADPLRTIEAALDAAAPGGTIELAAGEYPPLVVETRAPADEPVTVLGSPGARSRIVGIEILGSGIVFEDVVTSGWTVRFPSRHVTLRDVVTQGGAFITGAQHVRVIGGEISGASGIDGLQIKADGIGEEATGREPTDILIDGVAIRDIDRGPDRSHTECIQVTAAVDLAIRRSRFERCSTQGVFLKEGLGGEIAHVVIENNWFGPVEGFSTLVLDDGVSDVEVRYNSFAQSPRLGGEGSSDIVALGNAGALSTCAPGVAFSHNVWTETICGTGDKIGDPGFPSSGPEVAPDSPVVDAGDPENYPAGDIRGAPRPSGAAPDAGAFEA